MRPLRTALRVLAATTLVTGPALSADFSDPTWPCVQRKVERLSVGLMWPHPLDVEALEGPAASAAEELVGLLSLRRLPLEDVRPEVEAFVDAHGGNTGTLGQVFQGAFDGLAARRTAIINGIEAFSLKQIALSKRIDAARSEMDQEMAKDAPDYDRVDALEEQIDWDERIYTDRQRSLQFVCETPVLLEKRLYGIAQMLSEAADG